MTGMSESQISIHLRLLSSRGLIRQQRQKMKLRSTPEANGEVESSMLLLGSLKACYAQQVPMPVLFRQATAFTHARRIEIIQKLPPHGITTETLSAVAQISPSALTRHLRKLKARGFITDTNGLHFPSLPEDPFSQALLKIISQTGIPFRSE
jgi:DNA-binding transcriptional ArsR family regulator